MTLDLAALLLVGLFALWGAFSGFSKQVAHAVGGLAALVAAAPLGRFFAEAVAQGLKASLTVGVVFATILSFIVVYVVVRVIVGFVLRRMLRGKNEQRAGADRFLGFTLGGLKTAVAIWLGVSAAVFLENNLVVAGRKFTFTPKNSQVIALARRFNFIELMQFSGAHDLALAAKAATDPEAAKKLRGDPDYEALMKDPRFKQLLGSDAWKKALESGDVRGLMQNNGLVELIHDPRMSHHLERLSRLAD